MFDSAIGNAAKAMHEGSQFLFTVLSETSFGYGSLEKGETSSGWIYPHCVTFETEQVTEICRRQGLLCQKLEWFHPRQQWFRAVASEDLLLSPEQLETMDRGIVLFDERF